MSKRKFNFCWDDTGTLDVEVNGNQNATLRYTPSAEFIEKTLAKFQKNTANQGNGEKHKTIPTENNRSQNGLNQPISGGYEERSAVMQMMDFEELSKLSHKCIIEGDLLMLSEVYVSMAKILEEEEKCIDALKVLMLAFYIKLNRVASKPQVDDTIIDMVKSLFVRSGIKKAELKLLYLETIDENVTPYSSMTVNGSYRLFELFAFGKLRKAKEIVSNLEKLPLR